MDISENTGMKRESVRVLQQHGLLGCGVAGVGQGSGRQYYGQQKEDGEETNGIQARNEERNQQRASVWMEG